jgi:lipopolysaccharide/colanic/teichoic acid biosynthesis glycosyltransferase
MPIIDDVLERDRGGMALAVADASSYGDARTLEFVPVGSLAHDGIAERDQRWDEVSAALQAALKRAADILVSALVLAISLPLIAIVSLLVVLDSRGPVFYRAARVGRAGRELRMLKFRKMHHNASGAPLTMSEDARFTRIGRLLARTKIDELPQLWHVLRGEMSIIGPRPEDPGFVAERPDDYDEILRVRPGITGLSQIAFAEESEILCKVDPLSHYRSRIFPQKIKLDRMYAAAPSLAMDFRILFWTCAAVLLRRQVAVHRQTGRMNLRRR